MRSGAGLAVIAGVVALAGQGRAQEVVNPSWASVPEGDVMAEAYPEFASMVGLEGAVTLLCQVTPEGSLSLCVPVATVPAGLGFDQAALAVAPDFRANPRQVDGQATKSTIQFTIRFRLDGDETELPWTGPEPSERHLAAVGAMLNKVAASEGPMPHWDLEGVDLQVDPNRDAKVRAMIRQVEVEWRDKSMAAATLAFARLITPEQLVGIETGGMWPPEPPEPLLISAGDVSAKVSAGMVERLRQLYCADFQCENSTPVAD